MTRKKRRKARLARPAEAPQAAAAAAPEQPAPRKYAWIPLWGWVLIFALPLVASEFMFYVAGHWGSMVLFPVAWIGFWATMMWRTDWVLLKRGQQR